MRRRAVLKLTLSTAVVTAVLTSLYWVTAYDLLDRGDPGIPVAQAMVVPADGAVRTEGGIVIPVRGVRARDLVDSWDQSRAQGRLHRAIDIAAPTGTPVLAAMDGRIEKLFQSDRGGHTIYQRSADGRLILYYAHLQGYRRGLSDGKAVARGEVIGTVGTSGNADPAFPHLHFQMLETTAERHWQEGTPINPYPYLTGERRLRP